jgi:thiol-disulfide isomerase/thioredoxin
MSSTDAANDDARASDDAPTTLPTAVDDHLRPSSFVDRVGGIVAQPRRTFRALVHDEAAGFVEPLLVFAVVVLALNAADTFRLLSLAGAAPLVVLRRLLDVVVRAGSADLGILAGSAVVVALVARVLGQRALGAAVATAYLIVPLSVLKACAGVVALLGLRGWWLPHLAVDSVAVVVDGRVSVARFAAKCAIAYGPGLLVLLDWLRTTRARTTTPPPRPVVARRGLAVVFVAVVAIVGGAAANVLRRADGLRPRLSGDPLPSVPLKVLPGGDDDDALPRNKGRVDLVDVARLPSTKVLVVDFWASWCAPCRRSLPELSALADEYAPRGVQFVGVNREPGDVAAAQAAWKSIGPRFPSLVDDRGLGEKIGLNSLPSSYVVDHDGVIRHLHLGLVSTQTLKGELDALLASTAATTTSRALQAP